MKRKFVLLLSLLLPLVLCATVYTLAKTMSSRPNFRIVNSNGEERSDSVKTPVPLEQKTYEGVSTAEVGYGYYASLQPNWAQTGENKTIRIQFKVY